MPHNLRSHDPLLLTFRQFCDAVEASPHLWPALLVKTCTYVEKTKPIVHHRCLIVDICLGEDGHLCLRLDRRPTSGVALFSGRGTTPSNDEILLAHNVKDLRLEKYKLENVQIFPEASSTLRDLSRVLRAFSNSAKDYTLLSRNCWFLCSVVEEILPHQDSGLYAAGEHQNRHLDTRSRGQIASMVAHMAPSSSVVGQVSSAYPSQSADKPLSNSSQYPPGSPCTHRTPIELCATHLAVYFRDRVDLDTVELQRMSSLLKQECLSMLRQVHWDGDNGYASYKLARSLDEYGRHLYLSKSYEKATEVTNRSVEMTRQLYKGRPDFHTEDLSRRLNFLGICYDEVVMYGSACISKAECIEIFRKLQLKNPTRYTISLVIALHNYNTSLHARAQYQEACDAVAESVSWARKLHQEDPETYASDLAEQLLSYGNSLHALGSYQEAREALAESVALTYQLHAQDANLYSSILPQSLHNYGIALHHCSLYQTACTVKGASVTFTRNLHFGSSNTYASVLAERLHSHGVSLHEAGEYQEACDVKAESIVLTRELEQEDDSLNTLATRLHSYGMSLHEQELYQAACDAKAESIMLTRKLEQTNPAKHASELAEHLSSHVISLFEAGRYQEAHDASEESVKITRALWSKNSERYEEELDDRLAMLDICLTKLLDLEVIEVPPAP